MTDLEREAVKRAQVAAQSGDKPWWYRQVLDFCRRSNAAKWYRG